MWLLSRLARPITSLALWTTNLQRALALSNRKPKHYFIYPSLSPPPNTHVVSTVYICNTHEVRSILHKIVCKSLST